MDKWKKNDQESSEAQIKYSDNITFRHDIYDKEFSFQSEKEPYHSYSISFIEDTIKIDSIGLYEPTVNEDIQNCDSMQLKCMADASTSKDTNTACK